MKKLVLMAVLVLIGVVSCNKSGSAEETARSTGITNAQAGGPQYFDFGLGGVLGVVVDNVVKFYINDGSWQEFSDFQQFELPAGYKSVFSLGAVLGVVVDNVVKFYISDGSWQEFSQFQQFEFSLN
jgi:hypothetical protein